MENSVTVEAKDVSGQAVDEARILELLREVWEHEHHQAELRIVPADWIREYPDLLKLLNEGKQTGMIDVYPSNTRDETGRLVQNVALKPATVKLLKQQPHRNRRQVTDASGRKRDLRSGRLYKIDNADTDALNFMVPLWIKEYPTLPSDERMRVRLDVQDSFLLRAQDLTAQNREMTVRFLERVVCEPEGDVSVPPLHAPNGDSSPTPPVSHFPLPPGQGSKEASSN